jgi:hypothetical protein
MAKKSHTTPLATAATPTIYQDFFENGVAHCLTCHATGKVSKTNEPGRSTRLIEWSHGEDQVWDAFSAPSICDRCWVSKRRAQGKPL